MDFIHEIIYVYELFFSRFTNASFKQVIDKDFIVFEKKVKSIIQKVAVCDIIKWQLKLILSRGFENFTLTLSKNIIQGRIHKIYEKVFLIF